LLGGIKKRIYILIDGLLIENLNQPIENINGIDYSLIIFTDDEADISLNY
jgi:hypothetical protein